MLKKESEEKSAQPMEAVAETRLSMEKVSFSVLFVVRLRKFLKNRIRIRKEWDYLLDTNLVVSAKRKLILLRGKETYAGKVKNCLSCAVRYEIYRRGTFLRLRNNAHFVPFAFIMLRRMMAIRIVKFLRKFTVLRKREFQYQRMLSSESTVILELSEDEI